MIIEFSNFPITKAVWYASAIPPQTQYGMLPYWEQGKRAHLFWKETYYRLMSYSKTAPEITGSYQQAESMQLSFHFLSALK